MPTATRIWTTAWPRDGRWTRPRPAATGEFVPGAGPARLRGRRLHALGRPGGVCDAAAVGLPDPDAEEVAGWPVFGQFVAHDITADRSPLTHHAELVEVRNARSPRPTSRSSTATGRPACRSCTTATTRPSCWSAATSRPTGRPARNPQGVALLGDPRNDVHLLMSQLHVAMLHLHNGLVDRGAPTGWPRPSCSSRPAGPPPGTASGSRWRTSPRLAGPGLAGELLAGGSRHYRPAPGQTFIPLEFADAAFRYGHSQIRQRYQVNRDAEPAWALPRPARLPAGPGGPDGRLVLPVRPAGSAHPSPAASGIDGRLAASLIQLPQAVSGVDGGDDYGSPGRPRPPARPGGQLPSGEAGLAPRGRAAHLRGGRPRRGRLAAGDAALVLLAQGGRAARQGRAPGPGRRPAGRRPGRHRRRRRRVLPGRRSRLASQPPGRPAWPVRPGRPADL